jgi:hypothetical protein
LLTAIDATEGNLVSAYLISQVEGLDPDAWENYCTGGPGDRRFRRLVFRQGRTRGGRQNDE